MRNGKTSHGGHGETEHTEKYKTLNSSVSSYLRALRVKPFPAKPTTILSPNPVMPQNKS